MRSLFRLTRPLHASLLTSNMPYARALTHNLPFLLATATTQAAQPPFRKNTYLKPGLIALLGLTAYVTYNTDKQPTLNLAHPAILLTTELKRQDTTGSYIDRNGESWQLIDGPRDTLISAYILQTLRRELDATQTPCHIVINKTGTHMRLAVSPTMDHKAIDQLFQNPTAESLLEACYVEPIDTTDPLNYLKLASLPMTHFTKGIRELRQANIITPDQSTKLTTEFNRLQRACQDKLDDQLHYTESLSFS